LSSVLYLVYIYAIVMFLFTVFGCVALFGTVSVLGAGRLSLAVLVRFYG